MWLQKRLNRRVIKKTIGSEYVYQIEAEERLKWWYESENERSSKLKSFLQDGVREMKKEMNKKYE
jgi:hypothetical protein